MKGKGFARVFAVLTAAVLCVTAVPTTAAGADTALKVVVSPQKVLVDGQQKSFEVYNINGSNYFKLRDMGHVLNGTAAQFQVGYDSSTRMISVKTGDAYQAVGGELQTGTDKSATTVKGSQKLRIDGADKELEAYNIGGNNFFQLRAMGEALGFGVDYDAAANSVVISSDTTKQEPVITEKPTGELTVAQEGLVLKVGEKKYYAISVSCLDDYSFLANKFDGSVVSVMFGKDPVRSGAVITKEIPIKGVAPGTTNVVVDVINKTTGDLKERVTIPVLVIEEETAAPAAAPEAAAAAAPTDFSFAITAEKAYVFADRSTYLYFVITGGGKYTVIADRSEPLFSRSVTLSRDDATGITTGIVKLDSAVRFNEEAALYLKIYDEKKLAVSQTIEIDGSMGRAAFPNFAYSSTAADKTTAVICDAAKSSTVVYPYINPAKIGAYELGIVSANPAVVTAAMDVGSSGNPTVRLKPVANGTANVYVCCMKNGCVFDYFVIKATVTGAKAASDEANTATDKGVTAPPAWMAYDEFSWLTNPSTVAPCSSAYSAAGNDSKGMTFYHSMNASGFATATPAVSAYADFLGGYQHMIRLELKNNLYVYDGRTVYTPSSLIEEVYYNPNNGAVVAIGGMETGSDLFLVVDVLWY